MGIEMFEFVRQADGNSGPIPIVYRIAWAVAMQGAIEGFQETASIQSSDLFI